MDPRQQQQQQQQPHLHNIVPPNASPMAQRTANSTPVSPPGLFSPSSSRPSMLFSSASEGTAPLAVRSAQPYRVRETRTATVDRDVTGRKIINNYQVIEEIGRGQHGKVKLARNTDTGENVAIKIIPRFSKSRRLGKVTAADPGQNVKKEIAILKKIRHPNVVALLEVIDDPEYKKIYMVLEHVERGEIVWRKKGLPSICAYERRRIERSVDGRAMSPEEETWLRKQVNEERKRANARSKSDLVDCLAAEAVPDDGDAGLLLHPDMPLHAQIPDAQKTTSAPPSRTQSAQSMSIVASPQSLEGGGFSPGGEDDVGTTGALPSTHSSAAALEGTMYGAYAEDPALRGRSPSMADSIFSHMSSNDFHAHAHDPFADDFSYVPCFTLEQANSVFKDTVLGLEYLHFEGIVHRDIKPANLLWTRDYKVKISDFGVSYFGRPIRYGEPDDAMSESEALDFDDDRELSKTVGTPAFFAPELCYTDLDSDPPKVSEQIDIWSLGVTLYCLVFARIPFLAEEEFSMFKKIATEDVYVPRRRLKPVDPSWDPTKMSLYERVDDGPYRSDDDLAYEDVPEQLVSLLYRMLTKNPEKRIRLRDVKRHPWVIGDMSPIHWIEETDPSRRTSGRRIQVDEREIGRAVVPLTLLERARSAIKRTLDKVVHPRGERAESSSRMRATSSATSSAGDSPSNNPSTPYLPHPRDSRRKSIRSDDYFATITQEHPLTHSVTASPYGSPHDDAPGPEKQQPFSWAGEQQTGDTSDKDGLGDRSPAPHKAFGRHGQTKSLTNNAFLTLTPGFLESRTVPTTPSADGPADVTMSSARMSRDVSAIIEEAARARSVDRAGLVFASADKRAEPTVGLNTTYAPGNLQLSKHPRQMRSIDLGRHHDGSPLPSPSFFSHRAVSAYQHGQPKSDTNIHEKQRAVVELDERPATAHRVQDMSGRKTPPSRGCNPLAPEPSSRAQEIRLPPPALGPEDQPPTDASRQDGHHVDPARIPCPPSPDDAIFAPRSQPPSREGVSLTGAYSSSASIGNVMQAPATGPGEMTNPSLINNPEPVKDAADPLATFQSDPSLPALLSGASSVSADAEGDFLGGPGIVKGASLVDTADSLTPPALTKAPIGGFPLEHQELDNGIIPVKIDAASSATASRFEDDEDDSDSDGGLVMAKSKKKGMARGMPSSMSDLTATVRRRDTNTSTASTDTAKKVAVQSD